MYVFKYFIITSSFYVFYFKLMMGQKKTMRGGEARCGGGKQGVEKWSLVGEPLEKYLSNQTLLI